MSKRETQWSHLNHLQVGRYAEYFVKMEFSRLGFEVFASEVDDRGIDFVVRRDPGTFYEVQVKSVRGDNYVFVAKDKARLVPSRLLAVVVFHDEPKPELYLVPMTRWLKPTTVFVDRDYEGKKSKPEYGVNLSQRNAGILADFQFDVAARELFGTDVT